MAEHSKKRGQQQEPDSLMPMNHDAERAILGAILLDNQCYFQAALNLRPDDFCLDSHRRIYKAILELDANSEPFDFVTVMNVLGNRKELESIGGVAYLTSLTDALPRGLNIESYCRIVSDYSRRRQLIYAAQNAVQRAANIGESIENTLALAHKDVLDIAAGSQRVKAYKVDEYISEMFAEMRKLAQTPKEGMLGLTFGVQELDEETGGAMAGETVVIAGFSGDGKSLITKQMLYANLVQGVPCLAFTQEMTKEQYLRRMIPEATQGWIPGWMLRDLRGLEQEMLDRLNFAEQELQKLPLWTVDASTVDVSEMTAISRSLIKRENVKLVVDDFLQLMSARGADTPYDKVTQASAALRSVAKDEGVVTVGVSQLTPVEKGKKPPPTMFMLRGSGDIAQNAHMILFIYRPEDRKGFYSGKDQLRIGKMREGAGRRPFPVELDTRRLKFVKREEEETKAKPEGEAKPKKETKAKAATAGEDGDDAELNF